MGARPFPLIIVLSHSFWGVYYFYISWLAVFFLVWGGNCGSKMEFDLIKFTLSPTTEVFERCRKADLILIANFF